MNVQRLTWAGARLQTPSATAYIDALGVVRGRLRALLRDPETPLPPVPPPTTPHACGVVTHQHEDHYDAETLRAVLGPGGLVVCPPSLAEQVAAAGLAPRPLTVWESADVGDLRVTAVPAVDGLGDDQVSYVVEDGAHVVVHGGDTLWHGSWWRVAARWPRVDLALLPVNGPRLEVPGLTPSGVEVAMTPEQAVGAARVLAARALCPIHYHLFDRHPYYAQTPDAMGRLERAAAEAGVVLAVLEPGDSWQPPHSAP